MQTDATRPLYRGVQVVWYSLYIIEVLLAARFILKLTSANAAAEFTNFVYGLSSIFTWPFVAVFSNTVMSDSVFEWTTLLAMLVYWGIATALVKFLVLSKPVSTQEADVKLSREESV